MGHKQNQMLSKHRLYTVIQYLWTRKGSGACSSSGMPVIIPLYTNLILFELLRKLLPFLQCSASLLSVFLADISGYSLVFSVYKTRVGAGADVEPCFQLQLAPLPLLGLWCWSGQRTEERWEQKPDTQLIRPRLRQNAPCRTGGASAAQDDRESSALGERHLAWRYSSRMLQKDSSLFNVEFISLKKAVFIEEISHKNTGANNEINRFGRRKLQVASLKTLHLLQVHENL